MRKKMFRFIRCNFSSMLSCLQNGNVSLAYHIYNDIDAALLSWVALGIFTSEYHKRLTNYFYSIIDNYHDAPFKVEYIDGFYLRNFLRQHISFDISFE